MHFLIIKINVFSHDTLSEILCYKLQVSDPESKLWGKFRNADKQFMQCFPWLSVPDAPPPPQENTSVVRHFGYQDGKQR
jgi:hypothetical protein